MATTSNRLFILETERAQAKKRLEDQISSIRRELTNLEMKLNSDNRLYLSDGLQGNGSFIDTYLAQLVAYDRAIDLTIENK